jgi:hypothetical protein
MMPSQAVVFHPITFNQLLKFLRSDRTINGLYIPGRHMCADFAHELKNSAEREGIKSFLVTISFVDQRIGHMINAFPTIDKGLVYVDATGHQAAEGLTPRESARGIEKILYIIDDLFGATPRVPFLVDLKVGEKYPVALDLELDGKFKPVVVGQFKIE